MRRVGSGYLGGAHIHATVDAAKDIIVLLEAGSLGSRHAEAARVGGGHSEAGGLGGGGGGGGGQVGEGGALHLLHAIVPTVVMKMNLHGRNPACLHLQVNDKCTSGCYRRYLLAGWWPHRHCTRHTEDDRFARSGSDEKHTQGYSFTCGYWSCGELFVVPAVTTVVMTVYHDAPCADSWGLNKTAHAGKSWQSPRDTQPTSAASP